ncbi:hypothetical protein ACOME3_001300 [Neoechinorhynchus agilis]
MDNIRKALKKKKLDARFRRADSEKSASLTQEDRDSARRAAAVEAETKREEARKRDAEMNSGLSAIRRQVLREMEREAARKPDVAIVKVVQEPMLWTCDYPLIESPLSRTELLEAIEEKILKEVGNQPVSRFDRFSIIWTLFVNVNRDGINKARDILLKYIQNIRQNPDVGKYKQIRLGNKVYDGTLGKMRFIKDLMPTMGFELKEQENGEEFWLLNNEDHEFLEILEDVLAGPFPEFHFKAYRKTRFSAASERRQDFDDLNDAFFDLTVEDFKKHEERTRSKASLESQLMTKHAREAAAAAVKPPRRTEFTRIRFRLPDGACVDARFMPYERVENLVEYVE